MNLVLALRKASVIAALSLAAAATVAQEPPTTPPDPPNAGNGADLERSTFGELLRIGDGKEQRPLFKISFNTILAQYAATGQYGQVLRLCQYSARVAATEQERRDAQLCLRSALTNVGRYSEAESVAASAQLLLPTAVGPNALPHVGLMNLQWLGSLQLHQGNTSAAEHLFAKIVDSAPVVIAKINSRPRPPDFGAPLWAQFNDLMLGQTSDLVVDARSRLARIAYFRQDLRQYRTRVDSLLEMPALQQGNTWASHAIEHAQRFYHLGHHEHARDLAGRSVLSLKADAGFRDQAEPLTRFETLAAVNNALGDETTQQLHVQGWLKLATAYVILDRDSEAKALLDGTAVIAQRYLLEPPSANTVYAAVLEAQADLAAKQQAWPDAIDSLRKARALLQNAQIAERTTERGRRSLAPDDRLLQVDAKLLTALSRGGLASAPDGPALAELAGIASEFNSSRAGMSALLGSRVGTSAEQQAALTRENQLIDEMVDLRGLLASSTSESRSTSQRRVVARLADIYEELARGKQSGLPASVSEPLAASRLASQLGSDTAYWQWVTHPSGNFVMCWTERGLSFARLDQSVGQIRELALALQTNVDLRNVVSRRQLRPYPRARAHELYEALFGGLAGQSSGTRSWVLATSPLVDGVPWGALRLHDSATAAAGPGWLIERADLTVVPSWQAWLALRSRPAAAGRMRLLAVGDPLLPPGPIALAGDDVRVRGAQVARVLDLPPVTSNEDSAFGQELRAVAALFPARQTVVLRQGDATKAKLASLNLSDFNTLLFSTHGYLSREFAMSIGPSLELTAADARAGTRFLSASEIAKFRLDADLVILSACDTSASDGFDDSEGFSGLTSAFLLAGARDVIATLWPVETETTKELITNTLSYSVQGRESTVSRALQRASVDMIHSGPKWRHHPAFWAAFLVVGR